jgi:hypothetical protein
VLGNKLQHGFSNIGDYPHHATHAVEADHDVSPNGLDDLVAALLTKDALQVLPVSCCENEGHVLTLLSGLARRSHALAGAQSAAANAR